VRHPNSRDTAYIERHAQGLRGRYEVERILNREVIDAWRGKRPKCICAGRCTPANKVNFAHSETAKRNSLVTHWGRTAEKCRTLAARSINCLNNFPESVIWRRRNHDPNRARMHNAARICLSYRTT
jgi:hypothetical protein